MAAVRWVREHLTTLLVAACLIVAVIGTYLRYEPTRDTVIRQTTPCQIDSTSRACADYITRISRDEPIRVTCIRWTRAAAIPLDECPALVKREVRQEQEQDRATNESTGDPDAETPDQPTSDDGAGGDGLPSDGGADDPGDSGAEVPPSDPDPPPAGGGGGENPDDPGTGGGGGTPTEPPPADSTPPLIDTGLTGSCVEVSQGPLLPPVKVCP